MLVRLKPMRSTTGPPTTPATTAASKKAPPVRPVLAALPVVCKTNHGIATNAKTFPVSETALAPSRARIGMRRTSPTRAVSVSQIRATTYGPPCAPKADGGYKADHTQGRVGVQIGDAECYVAGRVDGVEDRVEERHHLEHAGQHAHGVEHPSEERKGLDDDARNERDVLYPRRQGADHRAKRGEREGSEKPDHHEHQRVFDLDADERNADYEDCGPHHHPAQHTAQRVGERDLQVAHRTDEHLIYVALALGVEDRPGRVHLRVRYEAHQRDARQYVVQVRDAFDLLDAAAECD